MRITLESDYALRIIAAIATAEGVTDAKTVSGITSVTQRFTLKILHKLVLGGVVQSFKGINGGYKLKRPPNEITLKEVIELIDGPIAIARCLEDEEGCSLNCDKATCGFHRVFDLISLDLQHKLGRITIADVLSNNYTYDLK